MTILQGDCVEVMRTLAPESVDAIVTDPPYGLEFMGKEWDRLGDLGQASSKAPVKGDSTFGGRMSSMPSYNASQNVRCRACQHWRFSGTPCTCDVPDFPNHKTAQAVAMQLWHQAWATEALRVLKPGGYLLAFGGTRTFHRLTVAIEDAGFEIRDCLSWMYGSGFPKSLDVSKAIDKAAGATREVVGTAKGAGSQRTEALGPYAPTYDATAPATPDAATWQGWGTALKPAWEPIIMARKPLIGTVAANVLKFGTGAINVDESRITGGNSQWDAEQFRCDSCAERAALNAKHGTLAIKASIATRPAAQTSSARDANTPPATSRTGTGCSDGTRTDDTSTSLSIAQSGSANTGAISLLDTSSITSTRTGRTTAPRTCNSCGAAITLRTITSGSQSGRWPSNVALDRGAAAMLDEQSGERGGGFGIRGRGGDVYGGGKGYTTDFGETGQTVGYGDTGGASRFFKVVTPDHEGGVESCDASNARSSSSRLSAPGDSAPNGAAISPSPEGRMEESSPEPPTSATASGSSKSAGSGTPPTPNTERESSLGSTQLNMAGLGNPAKSAATPRPTGTTATTTSRSNSSGFAAGAIFSDTSNLAAHGGLASPSGRLFFTAKASSAERSAGLGTRNSHPTVKPVALMSWLVRMVTPPGGTVLDPFLGSGSTAVAAAGCGFDWIGIELDPEYIAIAEQRLGLFGLTA